MAGSRYGVVLCGGGPAATGIVLSAAADGRLDALLSRGVCLVERSAVVGPGALGHYPLSANTRGFTFLRTIEKLQPAFGSVLADPATQALARLRHVFPRLPLVGRHLEGVGRAVQAVVASAPGCAVLTEHSVREVRLLAGGGVAVSASPADGGSDVTMTADHAVLAMGGLPRAGLDELVLVPGLDLSPYAAKVCHADALLDDRKAMPVALREAVARAGEVVVVGGSHSAWSAAWLLVHDPDLADADGRPPQVTVLHRGPLRYFFWTAAHARAAGYDVDEARDVCPRTGVVHRHGGLRADARSLAWAATRLDRPAGPVRAVALVDDPRCRAAVAEALDRAGAIVAAVGYRPNLPSLSGPDGLPLRLAFDADGVQVTDRAQLVGADGTVLPELLGLGLGAGLSPVGELAGEPSYTGRLDAVSLYQAEVGRIVLDQLLAGTQR